MITNEQIMSCQQIAGRVERWHTWPMIRKPTVREHAGGVAVVYVKLWGLPRAEVLYYCLTHDDGELMAGDTPYGAKRLSKKLAEGVNEVEVWGRAQLGVLPVKLEGEEWVRFKIADLMEMWETAIVEYNMGNRYAEPSLLSCEKAMFELAGPIGGSVVITRYMEKEFHRG